MGSFMDPAKQSNSVRVFQAKNRFSPVKYLAMSLAIISSCQTIAYAADDPAPKLEVQQGTIDDTKVPQKVLNGKVDETNVIDGKPTEENGSSSRPQLDDLPPSDVPQKLNQLFGETGSSSGSTTIIIPGNSKQDLGDLMNTARGLFKLFLGAQGSSPTIELGSREPQLSSEEYRKMEYGVIGLDALLQLSGPGPVVSMVYPGTPADTAGIHRGDLIVKAKDHVFKHGEGQRVLWQIVAGRAGTPVDITVLRDGELLKFDMLRMNIEDIPDKARRRQYENLLSALGAPHYSAGGDLADSTFLDNQELKSLSRFGAGKKIILDLDKNAD